MTAAFHAGLAFGHWEPLQRLIPLAGRDAAPQECLKSVWRIPDLPTSSGIRPPSVQPVAPLPTVTWHQRARPGHHADGLVADALSLFFACHTPTAESWPRPHRPARFRLHGAGSAAGRRPRPILLPRGRDRRTFESAAYHNTLTIDGADPYPYLASGRNGPAKSGDIRWVQDSGLLAAEGEHHNYDRPSTVGRSRSWTARSCWCWIGSATSGPSGRSNSTTTWTRRTWSGTPTSAPRP